MINIKKAFYFFENKFYIFLFALILIGIFLRIFNLWDNVIFAFDQARDATRIIGIISLKHFKIVGPETDITGVFNGPLFYYILAPFYFLFKLNPNGPAIEIAIINAISALVVFYAGKILFNKYVGFLSAFFWIFSYEQVAYSHYISNASFMGVSAAIFFLGCAMYFAQKKNIGLLISAVGLGLSINFNFYLIYLSGFYAIFYFLFPRKIQIKTIGISLLSLIILLSPFIVAEIQFHFALTKALASFLTHQSPESKSFSTLHEDLSQYVRRLTDAFTYSFFSFNRIVAFILFTFAIFFVFLRTKEKKNLYFLYIWIFSTFPLFAFHSGVLTVKVINTSLQGAFEILIALSVYYIFKNQKTVILGFIFVSIILLSNFYLLTITNFITNQFFVKEPMTLKEQEQVIDYTYKKANGQQFSVCAVTNPLFVNTLWGYLYNWYGKEKYGYLPLWAGLRQDLFPSLLSYDTDHIKLRFFIVEPLIGIMPIISQSTTLMEDNTSTVLNQKQIGGIIVQERKLQDEPRKFIDSQSLTEQKIKALKSFINTMPYLSCYNTY